MDEHDVETTVDRRIDVRRADDSKRNATILSLAGLLVAVGIAWGTASAVVQQKVDRSEFQAYKAEAEKRQLADSIRVIYMTETLSRVEHTTNQTNERLTRFICDKQPAYCQ